MKHLQLTKERTTYLFQHLLGGFEGSLEGIELAHERRLITDKEYVELLRKNSKNVTNGLTAFMASVPHASTPFFFLFAVRDNIYSL